MGLVVRLQHQLAPFVELSDAPVWDPGHRRLGEDAVSMLLDKFEGLRHGLGD